MQKSEKLVFFDIDYTLFDRDRYVASDLTTFALFDEVREVLDTVAQQAVLGILSEGEYHHQMKKLRKTDILSYFVEEHIHIVPDKLAIMQTLFNEKKIFKEVSLVDDKLPVLHTAKTTLPFVRTIWIKRGRFALNQKPIRGFHADFEVEELSALLQFI